MGAFRSTFTWSLAAVILCLCILGEATDTNLALGKPTWQDSTRPHRNVNQSSDHAVDGNYANRIGHNSCTHTGGDTMATNSWWVVDLGDVYHVSSVNITNRGDCCGSRLANFNIALMSSPPDEVEPSPDVYDVIYYQEAAVGTGETRNFPSNDESKSGRYLVIQTLGDHKVLTLCEVEVFGYQCEVADENLALGNPTWQISTYTNVVSGVLEEAAQAVDGNDNPALVGHSCTHTMAEQSPWWVVDLGEAYRVTSVTITNRKDCCHERLRDFNIALMSSPPNEVTPAPDVYDVIYHQTEAMAAGETSTFASVDDRLSGRYLVIQLLPGTKALPLTLCEVKVAGYQCG